MLRLVGRLFHAILFRATRNPRRLAEMHAKRGVRMGSDCMVFGGVGFGSEPYLVRLGNRVKVTAGTQFITHNVFIGVKCIVLPGVSIGDNTVVGAGSVVTRDIPANSVPAGVPCRVIESLDEDRETARLNGVMTKGWSGPTKRAHSL